MQAMGWAMLIEGQLYERRGQYLLASWMAGNWVLKLVDAYGDFGTKQPGQLAAYRLGGGKWRELIVDPHDAEQVVYGATVNIDLAQLDAAPDNYATDRVDARFVEIMSGVTWEGDGWLGR